QAESDPDKQVLYRRAVFQAMGGSAKAINSILKQEAGDPANLGFHAASLAAAAKAVHAAVKPKAMPVVEKSAALPKIWDEWDKFAEGVKVLEQETAKLAATPADDLAAFGAQMGAVGKACKECHDNYKEKPPETAPVKK
ncbi:MAG: hypothetical protein A2516_06105, partial [Alphaproteobacteria bacterium RIFOXYD12_FULL_60_8]